jgi:hypothetical protein
MQRKMLIVVVAVLVLSVSIFADDQEGPEAFTLIVGPRIGASYVWQAPEDFTTSVHSLYPNGTYYPILTLFGITVEQRILLGQTKSHFAFQEVVLVGGLEQGVALPEGAFLIGYRDYSGFEFGIGPILHLRGVGVVAAAGYTLSFRGMYVPMDLSVIIPGMNRPASFAFTTGFNFQINRREAEQVPGPQKPEKSPGPQGVTAP